MAGLSRRERTIEWPRSPYYFSSVAYDNFDDARSIIGESARVVVLTGAGVSAESGVAYVPRVRWTLEGALTYLAGHAGSLRQRPEARVGVVLRASSQLGRVFSQSGALRLGRLCRGITTTSDRDPERGWVCIGGQRRNWWWAAMNRSPRIGPLGPSNFTEPLIGIDVVNVGNGHRGASKWMSLRYRPSPTARSVAACFAPMSCGLGNLSMRA